MPSVKDLPSHEARRQFTEHARRESRYRAAENRIRKIVEGAPPLTPEQRDRLALLLRSSSGEAGTAA